MKYKELAERRKEKMKGKKGKLTLIVFLYILLSTLIIMIPIVGPLICVPLFFGFCKEMCLILNGEQHGAVEWIRIGFADFAKSWQCKLWYIVKGLGPVILFIVSDVLFGIAINNNNGLAGLAGGLVLIGAFIWQIIVTLNYSMYMYELIYHSNQKAKDILENARRKIQNYKKELFCIFAKWFLVSAPIIVAMVGGVIAGGYFYLYKVVENADPSMSWLAVALAIGVFVVIMILAALAYLVLCVMATIMLPYIIADLNELYNEIDKESNEQPEMLDNPVTQ